MKMDLFNFNFSEVIRMDELRSLQDHVIHRSTNHIRNAWLPEIVEIIRSDLRFVNRVSPVLEGDRLDRFFQVVRMMM
jgi:hypothetical protein